MRQAALFIRAEEHLMPIRDVLFPMLSYPVPTATGSIESAVRLAAGLGAHIFGLTFELNIQSPVGLYADPINVGGMLATERRKSAANARDLIAAFDDLCARQGTMQRGATFEHAVEQCAPNELATILIDHARLRDLSIFPVNPDAEGQRSLVEALIFESGRPVLLLPEGSTRQLPSSFDTIAVAWDHSRPAARAVADALPMLRTAKRVLVVTVADEKSLHRPDSGVELCKRLARHGVEVTFDRVQAKGRPIGDVLESYAGGHKVDLMVMGGFGHSRLREFVLGGATKSVLTHPFTWTLVSH
jgi:nucleotide-binding universal stress UspA family protein